MTFFAQFLKTVKWTSWLAILTLAFGMIIYFEDRYKSNSEDILNYRHLAWAAFFQTYIFLMLPVVKSLRSAIYQLVHSSAFDDESYRFSGFISIAIVVGFTLILGLIFFNYIGHEKSAKWSLNENVLRLTDAGNSESPPQIQNTIKPRIVPEFEDAKNTGHNFSNVSNSNTETKETIRLEPTWIEMTGGFLGTFGDFFGGVLNPILTFGTLIALAITVLMQRVQLKEARIEANRNGVSQQLQAFETTFFNMLNLHAENARHLTFDRAVFSVETHAKLSLFHKVVGLAVRAPKTTDLVHGRAVFAAVLKATARSDFQTQPQVEAYRMLQVDHNDVLGHYFRHLYQILDHVDRFKIDGQLVAFEERKRYSNILRAQLSSYELAVLLLNCVEKMVDDGAFIKKVIHYQLLEHLPVYETADGELRAPGIDPDNDDIFFEYFDFTLGFSPERTSGAFGGNPAVAAYLKGRLASS